MMRGLLCALFSLAVARAQTATPAPEATGNVAQSVFGSISGHVYCADINAPARFATVTLLPAPEKAEGPLGKAKAPTAQSVPPAVRTGLDGSFHFSVVRPGTYFLVADYPGYVSPIAKLSADELKSKEPSDIEKVEKLLVKVTVAANKDSGSEIELERGAAIAGTVRYDDGSPASEIQIAVLRLGDDGKASTVSVNLNAQGRSHFDLRNPGLETNDLGHYRVSGLPAGKYIVMTTLPTTTNSFQGFLGGPPATEVRMDATGALSVYSGNVFREKDAKPIEVTAGTERDGSDITIPLLGLHSISGSVTALADGHAINWGSVSLLRADDKSVVRYFHISENPNDGQFNFRFVPDGEYILRVKDPADAVGELQQAGGVVYTDYKQVHHYASVDMPISVHTDLSNVNISVPDQPTATTQKQ
jgi:5-hydroxyisourate hydrolase-like protein (transthyretin family)